ncbi:MAG: hypothetical protein OEZ34_16320 [Spirochaetia bacterium]|nr:hypothetical protein [Spirochaetia bacterium]
MYRILFINIIFTIVTSFFSCALFNTGAREINPAYLKELKPDEEQKLSSIRGRAVITKNGQKDAEKNLEIILQKIRVCEKMIIRLASDIELLKENEKLAVLSGHGNENSSGQKIPEVSKQKEQEVVRLEYLRAKKVAQENFVILKKAELAKELAEIKLIESGIAERNQKQLGISPDSNEFIKVEKYKINLKRRTEDYSRKETEYKTVSNNLKPLIEKMKAAGVEEDLK